MKTEDQRFREAILKGVKEVLETESRDRKLEVTNVTIPQPRNPNDLQRIKAARVNQGSYADKVYADVKIIDKKTGRSVKEGRAHIADIPIKTNFNTYLIDGAHYQNTNQSQLKGTAYTRKKASGEIISDFRLERGWSFENDLDPETEKFTLKISDSKYSLLPILKALDTSDEKIQEAWGKAIFNQNIADEKAIRKVQKNFATKVFGKKKLKGKNPEEIKGMIKNHFEKESHINPEASRLTLGNPYNRVTADVLLASTKKILGIYRQEIEPDNRDEIYYKRFRGIPETGYEYLTNAERKRGVQRRINRRIDKYDNKDIKGAPMASILGMDLVNPVIKSIFTQSKLRGAGDTTNLLDMLSNESRITIMGEGGIKNIHKIMLPARDVHPSAAGFIDPVMTPQGSGGQSEHIAIGSEIRNNHIYTRLLDLRSNKKVKLMPEDLFGKVVAFPGELKPGPGGKLTTVSKDKIIKAVKDGSIVSVGIGEVDYTIPNATEMYSLVTNLVPFLDSNSGGRSIMSTGQMTQAVPLHDLEIPLVSANGFEKLDEFALGARSPVEGTVERVYKDKIKIRTKGGSRKIIQIYDNLPLNRDAFLHSRPLVKKGDKVKVGDLLADNNFTKNGILAMGKNLITAIMPYKGYNYEDGIVVSENAAKSLSSDHLYDLSTELTGKSQLSTGRFATYGRKYPISKKNMDATNVMTGLIKPGTKVEKGDVLAQVVTKTVPDPEDAILKTIRKGIIKPFKADPIVWENDSPGIVTESKNVGRKINLFVKSTEIAKVGDKLCLAEDHEVLTKDGWKSVKDISVDDIIYTLDPDTGKIELHNPEKVWKYDHKGKMYLIESQLVNQQVTLNHRLYAAKKHGRKEVWEWELIEAEKLKGKRYKIKRNGLWNGKEIEYFELSAPDLNKRSLAQIRRYSKPIKFRMDDWLEFLGYYISEGSTTDYKAGCSIKLSQSPEANPITYQKMSQCLTRMGIEHFSDKEGHRFNHKTMGFYLKRFGYAREKYITPELFALPQKQLKILFTALMDGDGHYNRSGMPICYHTISERLANDFQHLLLLIGWSGNIKRRAGQDRIKNEKTYKCQDSYRISVVSHKNEPTINHGHTNTQNGQFEDYVDYDGKVYCLTVPNHIFYTRRKGIPGWTGNSDRHGHKGIITKILADNEMPMVVATKIPIDIMIDPVSIPSRTNVGQLLEMGASKISKKTGKTFVAKLHGNVNNTEEIKRLMDELGISDKEDVIDPLTGKTIHNINVAPKYTMKLQHQVEHKMQSRSPGAGYDIDRQPIKGRTIDRLAYYALVAHGAKKNLAEMSKIKAEDNPEWWAQFEAGVPTVLPKEPTYTWRKFEAQLKAMGINPRREGNKMVISPLTDAEVLHMSNGEIRSVDVVRKKDFKPAPGGIFDPELTGGRGTDAKQWTHIKLPEPVLNPIFLRAASKILKRPGTELERISKGMEEVNGLTGGPAIKNLLDGLNVSKELIKVKSEARAMKKAGGALVPEKMDVINKRIRFLEGLKKYNLKPSEAYMMNVVPVMPPIFRHPIQLPDGKMSFPAANFLYKDVALMSLKSFDDAISDEAKQQVRSDLYDSVSALMGIGEPVSNADAPGFLKQITGKETKAQKRRGITRQAKEGFFQRKVMRKRQDFSGGSVISVEPSLDVDEVEIPEKIAWDIYGPTIVRRLRMNHGMSGIDARNSYNEKSDISRSALLAEMKQRPVFINRAPSWHKFNIMAAWPKLHSGDDLKVPTLPINTYFGGDFDGDTMSIHVPITKDAIEEAKDLMPSKLFTKSGSGTIMLKPQGSAMAGLFDMTKDPEISAKAAAAHKIVNSSIFEKIAISYEEYKIGKKIYESEEALKSAYERGDIKANDILHYTTDRGSKRTTVGRMLVNHILPKEWSIKGQLDATRMNQLLEEIGKEQSTQLAPVANALSRLGDHHATYMGLSLGIDDMITNQAESQGLVQQLKKDINYIDKQLKWKKGGKGEVEKREKKIELFDKAIKKMDPAVIKGLPEGNQFKLMWASGAKGKPTQLRQIVGPPTLFMSSSHGEILHPVENSFSHGLTPAEYYIQQTGGRFGLVQKVLGVSAPGEIGKDLLGVNSSHSITEEDCGTTNGKWIPINRRDAYGRYLAKSNAVGKYNELVTEEMVAKLRRKRIRRIYIRSPLTCKAQIGVCSKCYGLTVHGYKANLGDAVGVEDSQGVVDIIANLALKSWHLSGGKEVGDLPFNKFSRLINMPKNVPDKAILARENGTVGSIIKNEMGGVDVYINNERHRLPSALGIKSGIVKGARIKKGDVLTMSGNVKPQELLELKGIEAAQDFMVDEMTNIFKSDQPGNISRKSVENIIASMTGLARVTDPGDSEYVSFDIGKSNEMSHFNNNVTQEVKLKDAVGFKLSKDYDQIRAGTEVDRDIIKQLRRKGNKVVQIKKRPIRYEPILKPIGWLPQFKNDWISRLNQKRLKDVIQDEAAYGSEANIHGPDPIPAYAYGGEFGMGKGPVNY